MNVLKKKVIKTIPLWMLALILIGTAAGAFLWVSNLVSTDIIVTNPPVSISGSFESPHYVSIETTSTFDYTVNNPGMAIGYIIIEITQPGMTLAEVGSINVLVETDMGGSLDGLVIATDAISAGYRFVFCDSVTMLGFDFTEPGTAAAGLIHVSLTFEGLGTYTVSMQISGTDS